MILMVIQGSGRAAHSAARAAPGTALGIQALRTARFHIPWGRRKMWFNICRDLISAHSFSSRHSVVTAWQDRMAAGLSWLPPVTAGCSRTLDNGLACQSLPWHLWFCLLCRKQNAVPISSFILLSIIWYEMITVCLNSSFAFKF